MKKVLPTLIFIVAIFLASYAIFFFAGVKYGKAHPDKIISPLPIDADCIQLNIEVNRNQPGNIERNNNNEKTNSNESTDKPVQGVKGKSDSATELRGSDTATASYYTTEYCERYNPSCRTASGEIFNDYDFTAACANRFKLGTKILLTSETGSVTVKCNDRGSFEESYGRMFDLSKAAFLKLSPLSKGVVTVGYKIVD